MPAGQVVVVVAVSVSAAASTPLPIRRRQFPVDDDSVNTKDNTATHQHDSEDGEDRKDLIIIVFYE